MTGVLRGFVFCVTLVCLGGSTRAETRLPSSPLTPLPLIKPFAYVDPTTRIVIYVESDGRHLSAIGPDGTVLWTRNPYVDIGSHYYRRNEQIVHVGPLSATYTRHMQRERKIPGPFVGITFDSTQFGALDLTNGNFSNLGQD